MFLSEHHNNPIRIISRQSEWDWINQFSEENEAEPHPAAAETRGSLWTMSTSGGAGNPTGLLSMRLNLKVWRHVKVFQRARPLSVSENYLKKIVFPNSPVSDCLMKKNVWCFMKKKQKKKHLQWKNALMRVSFKPSWGFIVDGRGSQSGCCDGRPGVPQDNYIIASIFNKWYYSCIIKVRNMKYEVTLNHSLTQPRRFISRFPCLREINRLCKGASTLQLKLLGEGLVFVAL